MTRRYNQEAFPPEYLNMTRRYNRKAIPPEYLIDKIQRTMLHIVAAARSRFGEEADPKADRKRHGWQDVAASISST